ncbi:ATP-binding protein [Sphingobium sp.]|uniref:sensor histidine kinase n=1 Tax=Sphingobium sp. TaxID=1912891 RepID=UPI003B3A3814
MSEWAKPADDVQNARDSMISGPAAPFNDAAPYVRLVEEMIPSIVVSAMAAGGGSIGPDWRIERVNRSALDMFGAEREDHLIGESVKRLVSVEDFMSVQGVLNATMHGVASPHYAILARTIAGDHLPVRVGACAVSATSVRLVFATRERSYDTMTRLQASEQRYRQLFHDMPIALLRIDALGSLTIFEKPRREGVTDLGAYLDAHPQEFERALDLVRIADANEHAETMFGTGEPRSMLRNVRPYWEARPDTFRRILIARYTSCRYFMEETVVCGLAGQRVPVLLSQAFPTQNQPQGNSLIGMIDISGQVRAEAELQRMQASFVNAARASLTSELSASIAHEVNQPLSSIAVNGQTALLWLDKFPPDLDRAALRMQRVVDDARRATDMIQRLRDMSSGIPVERVPISLNDVVQEALTLTQDEGRTRSVDLRARLDDALPMISGNHVQLTQVVVNLITNGLQAVDQSGAERRMVEILSLTSDDDHVTLEIADSGPGIGAADRNRIFDSFFTTKQSGLGMGLAICRSIVASHDGRLTVGRSGLGGASFVIRLPTA